jgi:hypothetical protein
MGVYVIPLSFTKVQGFISYYFNECPLIQVALKRKIMKFKFLKQLALGFALVVSANATAGIISSANSHTTSDGSVVNLSGLDWLSWDVTTGQSRTTVENGFDGLLDDGWRYATVMEYKTMMESVFDTYDGWSSDNADGALWLYDNLYGHDETSDQNTFILANFYGSDMECDPRSTVSCYGLFGFFSISGDLSSSIDSGNIRSFQFDGTFTQYKNQSANKASVLVRATNVAEPSTLYILALGMIGLASRRFKKQS